MREFLGKPKKGGTDGLERQYAAIYNASGRTVSEVLYGQNLDGEYLTLKFSDGSKLLLRAGTFEAFYQPFEKQRFAPPSADA